MTRFLSNPYILSGLAVVIATLARAAMTPLWGSGYTFISYYPAIMFSLWVGGWKVGLAATLLSGLLSLALFLPADEVGTPQIVAVGFFLLANGGLMLMAESWRRARVRAEAQAARADARAEEQRLSSQAVEEQQHRLVGILDAAMDAVITVDEQQRIILFNPAAERMFGYRAADVLGTSLEPLLPPRFRAAHGEHIRQFGRTGVTSRRMGGLGSISGVRSNGEEFPIEASISQVDAAGSRWFTVILRDITERKEAEVSLREALAQYQSTFDNAAVGIAQVGLDGRWLQVNDRLCAIVGYARDDLLKGTFDAITHPEDVESDWGQARRLLTGEISTYSMEKRYLHKEGRIVWVNLTASLMRDEAGRPKTFIAIVEDITERKRAQEGLQDQLNLVKTITDNTSSCLLMMDPQGRGTFANPAAELITGFRPDELIGRVLHEVIHHTHPDDTPFPIEDSPLDLALPLQESVQGYEDVFVHKDGHFYPVRCAARPILKEGVSIGTVIEVQDITKERQAAEDLRALATDLERRVRERTIDLVRSQDRLRTLASQLAMAEQRARHRLATELHDYLAQLLALGRIKLGHARRLLGAVPTGAEPLRELQDILDRALAYTRTVMAELSPPVLHDLGLAAGLEWLGQQMARHGLTVTVTSEPEATELATRATEDLRVMLFQSARELLMNVVKHAGVRAAGLALKREQSDRLVISVRDEGKGFDPAGLDRRPGGADQFGLFSLRERFEAVGGRMEVESAPGLGTTVTLGVVLPGTSAGLSVLSDELKSGAVGSQADAGSLRRGNHQAELGMPGLPQHGDAIRVLLADDHVMVRQGLRGILDGYADVAVVGEAGSGEEAVALSRELCPDVVLMDLNMPRMDGLEATALIVKERPGTVVIGLSVNSSMQIREAMQAAGAVAFVTKESAADRLYDAVCKAVGQP